MMERGRNPQFEICLRAGIVSENKLTQVLQDASAGCESAAGRLLPLVYDELRGLAQHYLNQERREHTLQATALVHEAYLKLVDQKKAQWRDRTHFFAVAAQAIRRILVDHARGKQRIKRGGGQAPAALDEQAIAAGGGQPDLVELDEALGELARLHERQARIVEMRFFGGMSIDEIAAALDMAPRTVDGDWAMARTWLRRRIESAR